MLYTGGPEDMPATRGLDSAARRRSSYRQRIAEASAERDAAADDCYVAVAARTDSARQENGNAGAL